MVRLLGGGRTGRRSDGRLDDQFARAQPEGTGCVEDFRRGEPQFGAPHRGIDGKHEPVPVDVGEPRMGRQRLGQAGAQPTVQFIEPQGTTDGIAGRLRQQRLERRLRGRTARGSGIRHRNQMLKRPVMKTRQTGVFGRMLQAAGELAARRPGVTFASVLCSGLLMGAAVTAGEQAHLRAQLRAQQAELENTRRGAQRELNALAARLGELQAEANRLNALGERLTRIGQLQDGEFDFERPVGVGGPGPVRDITIDELQGGMVRLDRQFAASGEQLGVLEALLFNRQLDMNAVPSREPITGSYITSGFGRRADPFGGGSQFHKGIDFEADVGDPVLAVADGVVSFAGVRAGYGNVIEVDHGNGYVTRYAHNSRLTRRVGDLVRAGQEVAKAGSSGRSTGAHVHFEVWENGRAVNPRKFLGQRSPLRR